MKEQSKNKETRVKWNVPEEQMVLEAFLASGPASVGEDFAPRIRAAMRKLPEDRQRVITGSLRKWVQRRLPGAKLPKSEGRVVWTAAEMQAIIANARARGRLLPGEGKRRYIEAVKILPPERRRNPEHPNVVQWFIAEMKKPGPAPALPPEYGGPAVAVHPGQPAQYATEGTGTPTAAPETPPAHPQPILGRPVAHANQWPRQSVLTSPEDDAELKPTVAEELADTIGAFLGDLLAKALAYEPLQQSIRTIVATALNQPPPPQAMSGASFDDIPNPLRKPKLLIAGLKGHQMTEIEKAVGNRFVLKFWHSGESLDALRRAAKEADINVGFTNFIGHPAEAVILSRGRQKYVRHSGGLTTLKARLQELATVSAAPNGTAH